MTFSDEPREKKEKQLFLENQFGKIPYEKKDIVTFPDGIYGYVTHKQFIIWNDEKFHPFLWLISLSDPCLMFPMVNPKLILPDYQPRINNDFEWDVMLTIVSIGDSTETVTTNLRAPLVISTKNRTGKQAILTDSNYSVRHKVLTPKSVEGNSAGTYS